MNVTPAGVTFTDCSVVPDGFRLIETTSNTAPLDGPDGD
jgi:hypothetical protein